METVEYVLVWVKGLVSNESFATIICGVLVFVFCEYIKEIWLRPLQDYGKLKSKIVFTLVKYANLYKNPCKKGERTNNREIAAQHFRTLAGETAAFIEVLPLIKIGIAKKGTLYKVSTRLIGLSNGMFCKEVEIGTVTKRNDEYRNEIRSLLKIYEYGGEDTQ